MVAKRLAKKLAWLLLITTLIIFFLAILLENNTIKKKRDNNLKNHERRKREEKICPHNANFKKSVLDKELDLTKKSIDEVSSSFDWKCAYCSKVIQSREDDHRPYFKEVRPELIASGEKHLRECEEFKKITGTIDNKRYNNLIYDNKKSLREKGYNEWNIEEIRSWGLINKVTLPCLKGEKRIGVVKVLSVRLGAENNSQNFQAEGGHVSEGLVFLTPRLPPIIRQDLPSLLLEKSKLFFPPINEIEELKLYEKVLVLFFVDRLLQRQKSWDYNVYSLGISQKSSINNFFEVNSGESGSLSLYLSLLSAYYKKPISKEVAATGFIDIGNYSQLNCPQCFQEEIKKNLEKGFFKHKISPVGGLAPKVSAAVEAGVKKLILSAEQKEDYEKNVSQEIREKLSVYYVKKVGELEKLLLVGEFS